jgi:hypothetical protein
LARARLLHDGGTAWPRHSADDGDDRRNDGKEDQYPNEGVENAVQHVPAPPVWRLCTRDRHGQTGGDTVEFL